MVFIRQGSYNNNNNGSSNINISNINNTHIHTSSNISTTNTIIGRRMSSISSSSSPNNHNKTRMNNNRMNHMNKSKIIYPITMRVIVYCFFILLCLRSVTQMTTLWNVGYNFNKNDNDKNHHHPKQSLDAIVTVAMCGFDAKEMVTALRTAGQWTGPIYVITDSPKKADYSNDCTTINVQGIHPAFEDKNEYESYVHGITQYNPEIYSKWQKTQLFNLIPSGEEEDIQTILFIDADMLAQQPLSKNWLSAVEPLIENPNCELILNPERWYTTLPIIGKKDVALSGRYNSGMMILKRNQSSDVLEQWSHRLVRPPFSGRDQGKLTESIDELQTKLCWLPSHWTHVQNQADLIDRMWFRFVHEKGTFLHLASAKKAKRNTEWKEKLLRKCEYTNL